MSSAEESPPQEEPIVLSLDHLRSVLKTVFLQHYIPHLLRCGDIDRNVRRIIVREFNKAFNRRRELDDVEKEFFDQLDKNEAWVALSVQTRNFAVMAFAAVINRIKIGNTNETSSGNEEKEIAVTTQPTIDQPQE